MSSPQFRSRQKKNKKKENDASELLNFRFPAAAGTASAYPSAPRSYNRSKNSRTRDRTPRHYKPLLQDFPLYTSCLYGFLLDPEFDIPATTVNPTKPCCDWKEHVWMVTLFHSRETDLACPICLQTDLVARRMTKCGHLYCLPCLLRHTSYSDVCPCCTMTIRQEEWKPVVLQTVQAPQAANTMEFVKLHCRKTGGKPYRPGKDPKDDPSCTSFCRFRSATLEQYQREILQSLLELERLQTELEQEASNMKVDTQVELSFVEMAMRFIQCFEMGKLEGRTVSKEPNSTPANYPQPHCSSFLAHDENQFYQSVDGQMCFLSSFNLKCLTAEFSTHDPKLQGALPHDVSKPHQDDEETKSTSTTKTRNKQKPLPDRVRGRVLDITHMQVSPKFQFLKHLPLYMDVVVVELDLNHLLSPETRERFKKEFQSRKASRQRSKRAEKLMDKQLKRQEESQIALRKQQLQHGGSNNLIEPCNSAKTLEEHIESGGFPSIGNHEEASPAIVDNDMTANIAFQFSRVCATNGVWPELNDHSSSPPQQQAGVWGSSKSNVAPPRRTIPEPSKIGKKTKKKNKIVLFSTGGGGGGGATSW